MMEKGSRKTAPPDTARVKVHRYRLQRESSNALNTVAQLIFILKINPITAALFIRPVSAPVLQLLTCAVCICAGGVI